ncbi:MAG: PVC-type heme-binding CxxCH protein, partial [Pirellulaceae bacterium]
MKMRIVMSGVLLAALFVTGPATAQPVAERSGPDLRLLFLGDRGHHQPAQRFAQLYPVLRERRINLVYTEDVNELQAERLNQFHGLILYANIDELAPRHAQALLAYVAAGHAFVPLHCASYCFRNQDAVVDLIGAQFQRHGTGVFRVRPSDEARTHPVMQQYDGFESWDETYVHTRHNPKDRIVLEYRDEGGRPEPWTWVRTHGQGRVFYTAWGHDERTWSHPGFQNLIERGIRWACGDNVARTPPYSDRPALTSLPADAPPFQYVEADVPFYPPGQRWGTVDTGKRRMQLPVSPSESLQHMVTPAGFRVELFASEPMLGGKPLTMSWDERGRLWVCEAIDYPNELHSPGAGRDRIRILEDSDGDGRADTSTVFAERLSIPTAITFYRSGAIVQDGRETVYLRDQDGDGRADLRKVLITGWALGDTHGGVSNFQYGLDNWFYAMQGYNASEPVYDDGRRKAVGFRMGFFRFRMEGEGEQAVVKDLEFLRSTNNNTWGLGISEAGLIFGSTANNNPSEFLPIPNRYYEAVRGWSSSVLTGIADSNQFEPLDPSRVRQVDQHGGFTAAAGHALYTARRYPREYWNRTAFVTEPTGHLIATFVLRPDGAGFRSKNSWNLLASNDEWTAPIMAEVGPDGNVWFIDWYNYIVQHNPTPAGYKTGRGNAYESELRDKKHGRIYRVVWTGPDAAADPRVSPYQLDRANPAELVRLLSSDNFFWRRQAQRLLVEQQATGAVDSLIELAGDSSIDAVGLNPGVIHALWTLAGLRQLESPLPAVRDVVRRNLKHGSAAVRRNAVLVL